MPLIATYEDDSHHVWFFSLPLKHPASHYSILMKWYTARRWMSDHDDNQHLSVAVGTTRLMDTLKSPGSS